MRRRTRRTPRPSRLAEVHRGPTTSVWQGRFEGRLVAVKLPHPGLGRGPRRRLLSQARRARAARHPRVLAPVLVDAHRSGPSTVWPWIEGRDLRGRLARHGRPDRRWGEAIADELDTILAELHRRGFAHGRLTPDHVLLDPEGRPVLVGVDPASGGAEASNGDRRAATAVRRLLTGGSRPDPVGPRGPSVEAALGPPDLPERRPSRAPVAVGAAVAAVLAVAVTARDRTPGGSDCPATVGEPIRRADVDGDGCDDALEWSATTGVLRAQTGTGPRAWRLGEPGDQLVLGDWDCDGILTPGLRRTGSNAIHGFEVWPEDDAATARRFERTPDCPPTSRP